MSGTLFVVATPIGNLEDISARALRILRTAAVIAAEDTRRTAKLLAHYGIATPTTSLHEHNEAVKIPGLIERLRAGDDVAVVSDAGTPTVSDPGQRFVRAAIDAGLRVEPIPGPSAVLAALAGSGFAADAFSFLGFPPTRSADRKRWFERLSAGTGIAVLFEAPHRVQSTLHEIATVLGPETPIVICRELTKAHEEWVRGPIRDVATSMSEPRGEYTIVVNLAERPIVAKISSTETIDWLDELGKLTKTGGLSKRRALNALARRFGMPPNDVYAAVEQAKKSAK